MQSPSPLILSRRERGRAGFFASLRMTQGKADGDFAHLELEPQHPHLPARDPSGRLSRDERAR